MNLATITSIFQSRCHEGCSLCDVEVCDKLRRLVNYGIEDW